MDKNISYPRLLRRVQAALIDSFIVMIVFTFSFSLIVLFSIDNPALKGLLFLFSFLVYEPMMVSFFGATIGHRVLNIRVRSIKHDDNINILLAVIRFIVKVILGWFSFIVVLTSRQHQAIHDIAGRSIVVNNDASALPVYETLTERNDEDLNYIYPSKLRRTLMILSYSVITLVVLTVILGFVLLNIECVLERRCLDVRKGISIISNFVYFFSIAAIIVLGWNGRLYGCRKKKTPVNI